MIDLSMSPAQAAWDNRSEPDFAEVLDEDEAREIAQGELDATPAVVAEWLHDECSADVDVLDVRNFAGREYSGCPAAVILAALMTCDRERMQAWVYALREKFSLHCDADGSCKSRADELLADDERERAAADRIAEQEFYREH